MSKAIVVDVLWKGGKTDKQISQKWNDLTSACIKGFKHKGNNVGQKKGLGKLKLAALRKWMKGLKAPADVINDYVAYYRDIVAEGGYK